MRTDAQRLDDVLAAAAAIQTNLLRGTLADDLVFDAIRVRLIEIGEAVKDIGPELLANEPSVPWADVARMRDHLAHRGDRTIVPVPRVEEPRSSSEEEPLHRSWWDQGTIGAAPLDDGVGGEAWHVVEAAAIGATRRAWRVVGGRASVAASRSSRSERRCRGSRCRSSRCRR